MNVLIIDNYDSFTFNLYQNIGEILSAAQHSGKIQGFKISVKRNDEITIDEIRTESPDRIIISPGPGSPDDPNYFGVCAEVIRTLGPSIPLLGVCLGMQGIGHVFGGNVVKANLPMHGKTSPITHNSQSLFANTPNHIEIMRYHSLVIDPESLPSCLEISAVVGKLDARVLQQQVLQQQLSGQEIMGIQHKEFPIYGIQYHPESFATEGGKELIENFLFNC